MQNVLQHSLHSCSYITAECSNNFVIVYVIERGKIHLLELVKLYYALRALWDKDS